MERKDAADWIYRGEGAANLVLAYAGLSPTFVGKVIRLQKAPRKGEQQRVNAASVLTIHEKLLWRDHDELISSSSKEIVDHLYVKHVMSPLLGPKYVDAGLHIRTSREFLESVEKNVICQRPAWRVDAARVDTLRDSVLLIHDHSIFPHGIRKDEQCLCVEIKPKCGFLPSLKFIAEENSIKRNVSRFRMHQFLKLRHKQVLELSEYDPLDLFSGSKDRICKAVKGLYSTPQNNFRVFLNGSLVFGDLGGVANRTSFAIGQAFEDVLKGIIQADDGLRAMSFIQLVVEAVYKSGVLDRLLEVQKLDDFDIEGAIHAYYNIISQPCMICKQMDINRIPLQHTSLHQIPVNESLKILKDYLVAATAKDCSLMISFKQREDGDTGSSFSNVYLESTNQSFDFKVHFVDLDLKPLKKMEEYYELDKKIVTNYTQMIQTEHEGEKTERMSAYESAN